MGFALVRRRATSLCETGAKEEIVTEGIWVMEEEKEGRRGSSQRRDSVFFHQIYSKILNLEGQHSRLGFEKGTTSTQRTGTFF